MKHTTTVEALQGAVMVKGKTAGVAFRQNWQPTSLCSIDLPGAVSAVATIHATIREIERSRGCGAFLFIDPDLRVFVISEERPAAQTWVRERFGWFVGYYRRRNPRDSRTPGLAPTIDGLAEDVADHMHQICATAGETGGSQLAGGGNSQHPVNGVSGSDGVGCSGVQAVGATSFRHASGEGIGHG